MDDVLRQIAEGRRRREAELPPPPAGYYWHAETRLDLPDDWREPARAVTTWELREVH